MAADNRDGLSRRVEQLAMDFRIRNAVKVMQSNAEAPDSRHSDQSPLERFEHNCELLQAKFPQRGVDDAHFDALRVSMVAPFTEEQVFTGLRKMSRNAATAIDGWTRDLLMIAISVNRSIGEDIGVILAQIVMSHAPVEDEGCLYFSRRAMDIVRAARLVGIPKPEGGIRPIVVSSFFAKLAGSLVLRRSDIQHLRHQFAINCENGAHRIIHVARKAFEDGKAIIRLDISNAYNATSRAQILSMLQDSGYHADVLQYFSTMYQPTSSLAVFGPRGATKLVSSSVGVRQGDAPSSFFFCLVMQRVCDGLAAAFEQQGTNIMCYMDDSTIITAPEHAEAVLEAAITAFEERGFRINTDKSAIVCKDALNLPVMRVPVVDASASQFKVLGAILNDHYDEMHETIAKRIDTFFDSLDALTVHPEIKHTLLYLCGRPKLIYLCATTPPDRSAPLVQHFQLRAKQSFASLIDVPVDEISDERLYADEGAALIDYDKNRAKLYNNSYDQAILNLPHSVPVRLHTSQVDISSQEIEYDSRWTRYMHTSSHDQLSWKQYQIALALRCNVIPRFLHDGRRQIRCACGEFCRDQHEIIRHALRCDQFSNITCAERHTTLKYALIHAVGCYGIGAVREPNFYVYENSDQRKRPDITFWTQGKPLVTDVTIVTPTAQPGDAAAAAADVKTKTHTAAANRHNHEFIPFAVETSGFLDKQCFNLFRRLTDNVPAYNRFRFSRDLHGAAVTAIAQFRAMAVMHACHERQGLTHLA